ncbi:MAG: phosphatase PAP2-related protein [Candidatus Azambacteria bacterium]|nr:phosphatase PAP2-related protein [Candidatus Azambacteria bacterium]
MKSLIVKHKTLWLNKSLIASVIIGLLFFIASLFVNYSAVKYATKEMGNATTDILLDNLPVINTDIVFSEGALLFVIFVVVLLILKPKTIPLTLKSVALFIFIRAIFVSMTHIAPYPDQITTDLSSLNYISSSSGADLFFSGHTGLPFLLALLFWENKYLKIIFLLSSFVAATAAIFGHLHYTIDIFSAFFITYGIYRLSKRFFQKDYKLFKFGLETGNLA